MISGSLFIVAVAVIAIWIIIEVKRLRHKVFALFLIAIIILTYVSAVFVFHGQDVNLTSVDGVLSAGKIYFSWLGSIFLNLKDITANAIHMDWGVNEDVQNEVDKNVDNDTSWLDVLK